MSEYWCCAQVESNRERVASHFLQVFGYQTYCPYFREPRRNHGRKVARASPLFPSYIFTKIVGGLWWRARWSPHVIRLVMDGEKPAVLRDEIVAEIRGRERNGFVELPKPRGLIPGTKVRLVSGPFCDRIGLVAGLRAHERVLVLLNLLGGQQRVELSRSVIEAVE
jgi:transcription antitermination factor NusG